MALPTFENVLLDRTGTDDRIGIGSRSTAPRR